METHRSLLQTLKGSVKRNFNNLFGFLSITKKNLII